MARIQNYAALFNDLQSEDSLSYLVILLTNPIELILLISELCLNLKFEKIQPPPEQLKALRYYLPYAKEFSKKKLLRKNSKVVQRRLKLLSSSKGQAFLTLLISIFIRWLKNYSSSEKTSIKD